MNRRRAPKSNRRQRVSAQRRRWDALFRFLSTLRLVSEPGRHVTGDRSASGRSRRNPWPLCQACGRRVPELCPRTSVCATCCPDHPHRDEETTDD